jgi:hypothetical protein
MGRPSINLNITAILTEKTCYTLRDEISIMYIGTLGLTQIPFPKLRKATPLHASKGK